MSAVDEYRWAADAQLRRYETSAQSITDTKSREYADAFGSGDCSTGPHETRVTFKAWLQQQQTEAAPEFISRESAFRMFAGDLKVLADDGDMHAHDELERRAARRAQKRGQRQ